MIQVNVRKNGPAQFGGIFTGAAKHLGKRNLWIQLACERLKFQAQPERVVAYVLFEMAGIACVDQQIACRMAHEDAASGHSDGKAAEGFSGNKKNKRLRMRIIGGMPPFGEKRFVSWLMLSFLRMGA